MDFITVEYHNKSYSRINGKWYDKNMIAVPNLQSDLDKFYVDQVDNEQLTPEELLKEGDRYKTGESYHLAIKYYRLYLETTQNVRDHRAVLPRLTSCYRQQGLPEKAISLYEDANFKYGERLNSSVLLTSISAAYCDIKDYDKAKKCADKAYALSNGNPSGELRAVYGRIRKETTGSGKFEN